MQSLAQPLLPESFPHELVLNNAIVGLSYMLDRRFLWCNGRMAEIFGYREGELTGRDVRILYATEDDYAEVGRHYPSIARDSTYTHERAMVKKNGDLIWCLISGRPVADEPGAPSVWVVQDISDRKQAEDGLRRANAGLEQTVERRTLNLRRANESLRAEIERRKAAQLASAESREKYRTLFRHLPLGVLVATAAGEVVEANRRMLSTLGLRGLAEVAKVSDDPTRVIEKGGTTTSLRELLRRGRNRFEFSWQTHAGVVRDIAASVAAMSGSDPATIFTFADITEHRRGLRREQQQRDALAHASRLSLMGQMASALAHELGQPLNSCQSYLAGLKLRLPAEVTALPDVCFAFDKMTGQLHQAGEIIRNVRSFMARQPPELESVDAALLVNQTLQLMEPQCREAGVTPRVSVSGQSPRVRCQPVAIQQVLANLLLNAIEAMAETPPSSRLVDIRIAQASAALVAFEVEDHGHGVAEEVATHLFDPYFTTKADGLGMGLMICRTLIEAHGGSIRHQRARGGGCCFRFTLAAVGP